MADEDIKQTTDVEPKADNQQDNSVGWSFEADELGIGNGLEPEQSESYKNKGNEESQLSEFSWQASDYVSHQRGIGWYIIFIVVVLAFSALMFYWQHSIFSVVVLLLLSGGMLYFVNAKPNNKNYLVDSEGITINDVFLPYETFRSFSVNAERGLYLLEFRPLKRFGLPIEAYMTNSELDQVTSILEQHLPLEERETTVIDKTINRLHL